MATPAAHSSPLLFTPLDIRSVTLRNRLVISPMCQYSATDGMANDWQLVHLGQFAKGGAGLVFVEATAVAEHGRITHGDLGLWSDAQVEPLRRIARFIRAQGAVAAIQLGHAGRKASMQRPWFGNGPLGAEDAARGDQPWEIVGPTAAPVGAGWLVPRRLTSADLERLVDDFAAATVRAAAADFQVLEIHGAHGYLLHSFLSPLSNTRTDRYGGDLAGRMRFPLAVVEAVRRAWPADRPLFFRTSAADGVDGGWTIDDTVVLARELGARGVDVIDCSSGGISGPATAGGIKRNPGFQVPFAAAVRRQCGLRTQAVGLILDGRQAEAILENGDADLIAVAREALYDPHFALHAARELGADPEFSRWPTPYGWWLNVRSKTASLPR